MAEYLTPAEAAELEARAEAEHEAKKAARAARQVRRVGENGRAGPSPSERVREACTLGDLRDYLAEANPSGRPSHTGNVRCPTRDHTDTDPSCSIVGADGDAAWHCHGCGQNGTLLDAVMEAEGLGFARAVERACDLVGIPHGAQRPPEPPAPRPAAPHPHDAETPPHGPADPADAALGVWADSPVGRWALQAEQATGRPAPAVLRAALAESAARLHGWELEGRPVCVYSGLVGPPSSGKTGSANVARGRIRWPDAPRWRTDREHGDITDFAPESPEGLLDELARGKPPDDPDDPDGERRPYPSMIARVDEGEFLHPRRTRDQAEATKRDLRTLWSGGRIKRRRKQSPDTPPRIVNHRPTVTMVINLTADPAARLLDATTGDAERVRLAPARRITDTVAPGEPPPVLDPPPLLEPPLAGGDIEIDDDVAAEVRARRHAHEMAIRAGRDSPDDAHTIDAELRDAAAHALLAAGSPHVGPGDWAAAKDLTALHRQAADWAKGEHARGAAARTAARGRDDADAAWHNARRSADNQTRLIDAAADLIAADADAAPITLDDARKAVAPLARQWKALTGETPADLRDAAAAALADRGWRRAEQAPRGGRPATVLTPPDTEETP